MPETRPESIYLTVKEYFDLLLSLRLARTEVELVLADIKRLEEQFKRLGIEIYAKT